MTTAQFTLTNIDSQTVPTRNGPTPSASSTVPALPAGGTLCIGKRLLPSRYFLAPLAGYTHLPLRRALRELGGLGLATTDLVLATKLVSGSAESLRLVSTHPDDQPLSVQIFGNQPSDLVRAARWLFDRGYQGVDLNLGCPMAKVNGSGGGARLMCDREGATRLVAAVVEAIPIPVTVKMRIGWDRTTITSPELARRFEQVGVAAITLHGRTRSQGFGGTVNREAIRDTVQAVREIPIIGNGDVRSVADAIAMRQETGCAAVAIGRGAMLDPWIFRNLADFHLGKTAAVISHDEQLAFLTRHFELMVAQSGERACLLFRKFAGWYGARMGIPEDLEQRLRELPTVADFDPLVGEIRRRPGERQSSIATALIKVPNGPIEHW